MSQIYQDDPDTSPNAIWTRDGKWFHTDETWSEAFGPFNTRAEAQKHLDKYCYWLEHGPTLWQSIWWPIKRFLKVNNGS